MSKEINNIDIINKSKAKLPRLAFDSMKEAVLGSEYELSVAIIESDEMQKLNFQHRGINEPTDILSFPLDESSGEIFINLEHTAIEAKKFGREFENFLGFLFIHGLVHLKGYDHGSRMEVLEKRFREQFGI